MSAMRLGWASALVIGAVLGRVATGQPKPEPAKPELAEAARLDLEVVKLAHAGHYDEAISIAERSLAIQRRVLGPDHLDVANALNNLGYLYSKKEDYGRAEPIYQRALTIREQLLGPNHFQVSTSLNNLALLYAKRGDYDRAEPLYLRALGIDEKVLGPEHPELGTPLNNLAVLYKSKGEYTRAEPLYLRSLAIFEKAFGPEHRNVAAALNNLAALYHSMGDWRRAEPLDKRALALREKLLGPDHPDVAMSLGNLATLYYNDLARAEPLYRRAIAIQEKAFGPEHPIVANSLNNLATVLDRGGQVARAVEVETRANDARERHAVLVLTSGSETQKRAFLEVSSGETDVSISRAVRTRRTDAARVGLTVVLRRKGRALDAMANSLLTLRRGLDPKGQQLLDDLAEVRSKLATRTLAGPGSDSVKDHRTTLATLGSRAEELEVAISQMSAAFRVAARPITLEVVQAALPENAAVVEWARYEPFDLPTGRSGTARYAAVALKRHGDPVWIDLGEAVAIESAVVAARAVLSDPTKDPKPASRALDALAMAPVRAQLGDTRRIFVSPDAALHLVPFGALVDADDRYLIERWTLTYVTSGRDLLRFGSGLTSKSGPLLIADPAFGVAPAPPAPQKGQLELTDVWFAPLAGTATEGKALGSLLPKARLLTGEAATEAALKDVHGPRLLHVATHGFFLTGDEDVAPDGSRALKRTKASPAKRALENPLLRAGLALAGANARRSGQADDGILTALEASALDLDGTKLVVLSACDTGVGEAKAGDGVYGLRRALVLAGAETQAMSLWKVDDDATRALMVAYYTRLAAGAGRSEAMQEVQLAMLAAKATKHPYFWAGFVVSGDPSALDGSAAQSRLTLGPSRRGCGCAGGEGMGGLLVSFVIGALVLRRRR